MRVRLHVDEPLSEAAEIEVSSGQAHYLRHVLRLKPGDELALFNGRDGEWRSTLLDTGKRSVVVRCLELSRAPSLPPDIDYLFAPLKAGRLDYLAQKATEMGVRRLRPVLTERTVPQRLNLDRLRANAVEAAEQCGLVFVPEVMEPEPLFRLPERWDSGRTLIHCDEGLAPASPLSSLQAVKPGPLAVLLGPEGGFSEGERAMLARCSWVIPLWLGPRIVRADTAAVAVLALLQATLGDWQVGSPVESPLPTPAAHR